MEKGLTKELASELKRHIAENEDWLIKRILYYAKKQGYTAYTSTLEEAWRASIAGLSKPILNTPSSSFWLLELHPHSDFVNDLYAGFGIAEAQKHRERGIDLVMFLGLFKYYRQTFEDMVYSMSLSAEDEKLARVFLKRYFDRVELGFITEWTRLGSEDLNTSMAKANRELTNAKSLYLTTLESLNQPLMVFSSKGDITIMNQAAAELFAGHSSPGAVYYGGQKAEIPQILMSKVNHFLKEYESTKSFIQIYGEKTFEVTLTRMKDVSDKFLGLAVILNDITDKRQTESVLMDSETIRRAIMEGIDAAALILDMEDRLVVDFNSKVEMLFSCLTSECGFTEEKPRFYEELGGNYESVFEIAEKNISNEERILELCDGVMKQIRLFTIEVWFQNKRHKVLIAFDISREKMLERRAAHMQQLEVLGDIACSIPNMLGDCSDRMQYLLDFAIENMEKDTGEALSCLAEAAECSEKINELICALSSVVTFEKDTRCIDINQLLKSCVVLTKDKWHPYADIDIRLAERGSSVTCRPDEIGQIFINLLINAGHGIRKKQEADGKRGLIKVHSRYSAGFFEVKISDTGIGIKKKDYKHIFDPGFIPKEAGRPTGNGLAIVYDLVIKRYKGSIEFKSTEGKGTEFILRLPV